MKSIDGYSARQISNLNEVLVVAHKKKKSKKDETERLMDY